MGNHRGKHVIHETVSMALAWSFSPRHDMLKMS